MMAQVESRAPSKQGLLGTIRRVWRQEGWRGVAWRLRARLWWLGLPPVAPRIPPLRRPELLAIAGQSRETFAAGIPLPAAAEPLVSVLVPALDHVEYTLCCLAAMGRHPPAASFEVVAVDDGSTDDSPRLLPLVPNLVYMRNEVTQGFVRSVNRAARAARGRFLLLLNNDTQVQPGWLDELVAAFDDPDVGIAGSKLVYPSGHLQEAGAVLRSDGSVELVGLNEDPRLPQYNVGREVDHCSGASLMIPRDLFLELGGFDEAYAPAYFEDCDLSLRVRGRGLKVVYVPGSVVVHHLSVTTSGLGAKERQIEVNRRLLLDRWGDVIARQERVRAIALYLPQYHPIPENDAWWGKGFTEWTNVAQARPLFPGHAQPRVPADLGFYDLRLPEVREAQAELAARHGLAGFCYYYYWFNGKRLLRAAASRHARPEAAGLPVLRLLGQRELDAALGRARRRDPHRAAAFTGGRSALSREPPALFRGCALHPGERPAAALAVSPAAPARRRAHGRDLEAGRPRGRRRGPLSRGRPELRRGMGRRPEALGLRRGRGVPPHGLAVPMARPGGSRGGGRFFDYAKSAERFMTRPVPQYPLLRTVMPSWDNSPRRRERAHVFLNGSPEAYGRWLQTMVRQTRQLKFGDERLVFINAWNEWAEGNYLEPDHEHGHAYLEATARALVTART